MDERLEPTARKIAARKMGLVKDPDGLKLPDDLWQQALPDAEADLYESDRDAALDSIGWFG
jgi:hypothetical protein